MPVSVVDRNDDDPVEGLVAECLARLSQGDVDPLADLCAAHPEHADELRRRHAGLAQMGLWSRPSPPAAVRIGAFAVLRELGRGGMGTVYLAHQTEPVRRLAAVKVITAPHKAPQALARFRAERQLLAQLVHPNIAQVLEAGSTADDQPWYAMEFVDGRPLSEHCAGRRLGLEVRLALFLQLCDAVQFAHQQGVLHRDLKPGNVLVCERGGRALVKVIDFGLAKALETPLDERAQLTEAGQILGTPEYMSPEQALPTEVPLDTRTDVYALGVMLYELCAGVLPFDFVALRRQGFLALQAAVCEQEPPPPSVRLARLGETGSLIAAQAGTTAEKLQRRLRGDLDWIAGKALAKERDQRYASVSELAADVRRHLAHLPVQAGRPGTVYLLRKFVRRHRAGVTFAAVLLSGLVVALVVVAQLLVQVRENLTRFDALQVAIDFAALEQRADDDLWRSPEQLQQIGDLWPATPARVPDLQAWLAQAQGIADSLPELRAQLAAVAALGELRDGERHFLAPRDHYLHEQLTALVGRLEAAVAGGGSIDRVRQRLLWAADVERLSVTGPAAAWRQAIATIADRGQCPAYDGLQIAPQPGFVPLGRDEHSRLYEFAFLQPGLALPQRRDGRWLVAEDTCMVFVLIPGGVARLGLDWPAAGLPADLGRPVDTEYLPHDDGTEGGRGFGLRLDPFLLSKYEMTHAQWEALMGTAGNPSTYSPERQTKYGLTRTHPVNTIDALLADEAMRRLDLTLPTSAQWQYAARGGAEGPWWTGCSPQGWHGAENLADRSLAQVATKLEFGECDTSWDDTFTLTAPVDSLQPNPFGLHHVLGNVREWSRDPAHKYKDAMPREGDGLMMPLRAGEVLDPRKRDVLGGSFQMGWLYTRSTIRTEVAAQQASRTFGLRPTRALAARAGR